MKRQDRQTDRVIFAFILIARIEAKQYEDFTVRFNYYVLEQLY